MSPSSAGAAVDGSNAVGPIAFFLPQFHPIPENDAWWGQGFTEWTNVTRARPLVRGHHQPHLPADLGFYDLRAPETREAQAALAREYGIQGFCYYHYWFNGRRLLNRPFDEVLASGRPDFPFCLCWANENWTRAWDGHQRDVLLQQVYSAQDDLDHIRFLLPAFRDPRYIRVGDRPMFLVYRASNLPDPLATTQLWREEARKAGLELHLCRVEGVAEAPGDPAELGFDAAVEFQPDWAHLGQPLHGAAIPLLDRLRDGGRAYRRNRVFDYATVVQRMRARPPVSYRRFPCVMPGWDNTARRRVDACVILRSSPEVFRDWLVEALHEARERELPFVFLNAWNEWAEGTHLEPDQHFGRQFLEAVRDALAQSGRIAPGAARGER